MSRSLAVDPNWTASDVLERARRLATVAAPAAVRCADEAAVVLAVSELRAACARIPEAPLPSLSRRRRARVHGAFERLALAADDLAAIVELRCAGEAAGTAAPVVPDLGRLIARIAERHDRAVGLLGRYGIRRTNIAP